MAAPPAGHTRLNMTRAVLSHAIDTEWKLVSNTRPCPVCGSHDACSIHLEDPFACCSREPSEWKLTNGSWLHKVQATSFSTGVSALVAAAANDSISASRIPL